MSALVPDAPPKSGLELRTPRVRLLDSGADPAPTELTSGDGASEPARRIQRLLAGYRETPHPVSVIYRLEQDGHRQTGVMTEVSVADYRAGRILGHEATRPERVRQLANEFTETGVELLPVALTHADNPRLRDLLVQCEQADPDLSITTPEGVRHTVWLNSEPAVLEAIHAELDHLERLYIVDGHHRMAAADQAAQNGAEAGTMAALFPVSELRLRGHPRILRRPAGTDPERLRAALAAAPGVAELNEHRGPGMPETEPGVLAVCLTGCWYRMRLAETNRSAPGADTEVLDAEVLDPIFGQRFSGLETNSAAPAREADIGPFTRWCAEEDLIAFLPHPPSVDSVLATAEAGAVMPAKSTWFEPKPRHALFLHQRA